MKSGNSKKKPSAIINTNKKTIHLMATVIIPTPLRKFTNNTARLQVKPGTVQEAVQELTVNFPDLKKHLLDENGKIRSYVNIFVGNDDIRDLQQERTSIQEGAVVS